MPFVLISPIQVGCLRGPRVLLSRRHDVSLPPHTVPCSIELGCIGIYTLLMVMNLSLLLPFGCARPPLALPLRAALPRENCCELSTHGSVVAMFLMSQREREERGRERSGVVLSARLLVRLTPLWSKPSDDVGLVGCSPVSQL